MKPVSRPDARASLTVGLSHSGVDPAEPFCADPSWHALLMSFTQTGLDVSEPLQFIGLANVRRLIGDPMFTACWAPR